MHPEKKPPSESAQVTCSCCWKTYRYSGTDIARGTPRQNLDCVRKRPPSKSDGALLVAASVVAAIRLRGEEIRSSPKLTATVKDSVHLARLILTELMR
jgi:hypothetical protein